MAFDIVGDLKRRGAAWLACMREVVQLELAGELLQVVTDGDRVGIQCNHCYVVAQLPPKGSSIFTFPHTPLCLLPRARATVVAAAER